MVSTASSSLATVPNSAVSIPPSRMMEALERVRPALKALPAAELVRVNVDIPRAVCLVLGSAEGAVFKALRPRLAAALPELDLDHFDNLATYARAVAQAHIELQTTSRAVGFKERLAALQQARALLKSDIEALARRRLLDATPLRQLRNPNGHRNVALDVQLCCTILRRNWSAIAGRTASSLAELDRLEELALQVSLTVAQRGMTEDRVARAADTRMRAFTLLVRAHDELRRALTYLRWAEGDADRILPSIYKNRGRRRRAGKEDAVTAAMPTANDASEATASGKGASTNGVTDLRAGAAGDG